MGPDPGVAAVRRAVRMALAALTGPDTTRPLLVAVSGGADSTALAAATAFLAMRDGRAAGAITVDHGLQAGSAAQAARAADAAYELGLDPVHTVRVAVGAAGGPEAAARTARYAGIDAVAARAGALVLLGHTRDDQAETVLLGLGRGSGPRSIAGMSARDGRYLRPLLHIDRATTVRACAALGLPVWADPHNRDPRFTRVRLRHEVLPLLDTVLGGGVPAALARTADLLRADLDALDGLAADLLARLSPPGSQTSPPGPQTPPPPGAGSLAVGELAGLPRALRTRVLRGWAAAGGAGPLSAVHLAALDDMLVAWRGQGPVDLPGGYAVRRTSGRLELAPRPPMA